MPNTLGARGGLLGKVDALQRVCDALTAAAPDEAVRVLRAEYPFAPIPAIKRRFDPLRFTQVFLRDGFICRYSGERLVFPPALRILSQLLPDEFPYHPNWKTDQTHPAYMQFSATIDHFVPVTRGGLDEPSNWMTASMARNSAKQNWTLDELGWELLDPGDSQAWDGLLGWTLRFSESHPEVSQDSSVAVWTRAGRAALSELGADANGLGT